MKNLIRLVEIESFQSAKNKIITRKNVDMGGFRSDVALAVLVIVKKDFELEGITDIILHDTDSYQIRPKALFKSKLGIYFNDDGRRYLSKQDIIDLKIQNGELGKYLD